MSHAIDSARSEIDGLFARAREGDQDAWRALFARCYPKVIRVIRRRLNGSSAMRSLYDSADFANDVWKSLAAKSDRFDFPTEDQLMAFLTQEAERKLVDEHRRLHTQKRDIKRELRLEAVRPEERKVDLASPDPTPSQFFLGEEAREKLLEGKSEDERAVIELRDQGYSNEEIAQRTGWHLRKVQRFLKDLHDSWDASGARRM